MCKCLLHVGNIILHCRIISMFKHYIVVYITNAMYISCIHINIFCQEEPITNHYAAKILENVATTTAQHSRVGVHKNRF